jgi:hypothetical protein
MGLLEIAKGQSVGVRRVREQGVLTLVRICNDQNNDCGLAK